MSSAPACAGALPSGGCDTSSPQIPPATVERRWVLKRTCCVMPGQFLGHMAATAGLVLVISLVFSLRGLWMVAVFGALELTLIVAATFVFARHVRDGETITLLDDGRMLVDVCVAGRTTRHVFNRNWARLVRPVDTPDGLWLHYGSARLRLAQHVPPEWRRDFETELRRSLPWRGPPGACRPASAPLTGDRHERPTEETT